MPVVVIQSAEFGIYLRMDAREVTSKADDGSGTVNCQYQIAPWEIFEISAADDDGAVTIASVSFPGVYLRMDAHGAPPFASDSGGGTVNCQYGVGDWAKFRLEEQADGTFLIGSAAFPGAYLRIDGRGVNEAEPHGGIVSRTYTPGGWERVRLIPQ